ncbi:MAG: DUF971 domain-containing protein [Beijerinckiaceae bacterium]|nr:DUF971 domain-containing protein [Beijerinckiaceae bacterium]
MTDDLKAWPVEIRLTKARDALKVSFDDGAVYDLPAELLRVMSPSAEVRGHSEAERKTVGGKRTVKILSVEPIGNYAVRIGFDDTHATGIYTWSLLADLGCNAADHWRRYERELTEKGLSRDRPGQA